MVHSIFLLREPNDFLLPRQTSHAGIHQISFRKSLESLIFELSLLLFRLSWFSWNSIYNFVSVLKNLVNTVSQEHPKVFLVVYDKYLSFK